MNDFLNIEFLAKSKILPCDVFFNDKVCTHTRKSGIAYKCYFEEDRINVEHIVKIHVNKDKNLIIPYNTIDTIEFSVAKTAYGSIYGAHYTIMLDIIVQLKNEETYHFETYAFEIVNELSRLFTSHNITVKDDLDILNMVDGETLENVQEHYLGIYEDLANANGLRDLRLTDEKRGC